MLHCILQPLEVTETVKESKYFFPPANMDWF